MKRFGRPLVFALFVLVMAITPLSAVTAGGHFEYRYPARQSTELLGHTVVVDDLTGLVAGIGPAREEGTGRVSNMGGSGNWLRVAWSAGGCESHSRLVFDRAVGGYTITVTSGGSRCGFLDLRGYSIVLKLWSPVDASTVTVRSRFDM